MDYTLEVNGKMKRSLCLFFGLLLALLSTSCGGKVTPPARPEPSLAPGAHLPWRAALGSVDSAQDKAVSTPTSHPAAPSRVAPASLPQICKCVLRFDHISIEQGLSQSSVWVIFQDSRGFLWFGTEDGLNRYDGYAFKTYKPDPDVPSSLSDRWITSIAEDKDGYLWIATRDCPTDMN